MTNEYTQTKMPVAHYLAFAGMPTATERGGRGRVTTAPAPTTHRSPTVPAPSSTVTRAPNQQSAPISSGPFVSEINGVNAYKYFENIGFVNEGALAENFLFLPFLIDQKKRGDYDGIPVIRGHASFAGDGTAIFRGDVDEGSTFVLLATDSDDVLSVTRQKARQVNTLPDVNGALLFPCIVRRMMTQRLNPLAELETVISEINPDIPFMMGYAGGEICPTSVKNGIPANRFHNYSLVILLV